MAFLLLFSATVAYNTYVCMLDGLAYTYYACDAQCTAFLTECG